MFTWAKGALASAVGTQEPEYGPESIHSVGKRSTTSSYTLTSKKDEKWETPYNSCVETVTYYFHTDEGKYGFVQIIYSNVAINPTAQFNVQIYHLDEGKTPNLWTSDTVDEWDFGKEKYDFNSKSTSITLSEDGSSYTIKSKLNLKSIVDIKFTKLAPAFVAGPDGRTLYGTDEKNPWGSMRHSFWPRCKVEGTIMTQAGEVNVGGKGLYIHALQGMKPHHCAARWNFINFQSPTYNALLMEFTTPPSYASTVVNAGGISTDSEIIFAGSSNTVTHTEVREDKEVDWPEPSKVHYVWHGKTADGKDAEAEIHGVLGERQARVDVMGELPGFIKTIASSASGTRPYIYQYAFKTTLKLKIGDETKEEEGLAFAEATFIS